jgi:glycosyltransferase involved in cell wall biosynthesis
MSLSVIILCKNEENNIERCLKSVEWADEIVVVDSYSNDSTLDICKKYTDNIYIKKWEGYGTQKQFALSKASKEWVLSLDADESLTSELSSSIKSIVCQKTSKVAYKITRKLFFLGKTMNYGRGKDKVLRLAKRKEVKFTGDVVHEKLIVSGRIGRTKGYIKHYSFKDIHDLVDRMNHYSSLSAKNNDQRKISNIFSAVIKSWWTFFYCYFLRLGFLDGSQGYVLSLSFAQGSFYRQVKLWQNKKF